MWRLLPWSIICFCGLYDLLFYFRLHTGHDLAKFGAKRERIHAFFKTACLFIAGFSLVFIFTLMVGSETLIGLFINTEENTETVQLALEFFSYIWPLFIFAGFNMLISGYLTAVHLPFQSAVVATSRSLIMPIGFLILFYMLLSDYRFVAAISLAEAVSFVLAVTLYISFSPKKIVPE